MKKFFEDFKAFAMKGNIVDMAIGVVIGGAFSKIVSSLVKDIITPLISMATGEVVLTDLKWVLRPEVTEEAETVTAEVAITYGVFLQAVIDFLIIALSIFIVMRIAMKAHEKLEALKKKEVEEVIEEPAPEEPAVTELSLLTEIRDLLQKDKE